MTPLWTPPGFKTYRPLPGRKSSWLGITIVALALLCLSAVYVFAQASLSDGDLSRALVACKNHLIGNANPKAVVTEPGGFLAGFEFCADLHKEWKVRGKGQPIPDGQEKDATGDKFLRSVQSQMRK